eukprot:6764645-Pyramimonas_sp.AAC.1
MLPRGAPPKATMGKSEWRAGVPASASAQPSRESCPIVSSTDGPSGGSHVRARARAPMQSVWWNSNADTTRT